MFDNSYARLPPHFYALLPPTPVAAPRLVRLNEPLARLLGFDPAALAAPDGVAMLAGNRTPADAAPLAMAYAGHQFGNFVPQLGDGRAILLGEIVGRDGVRRDIQLKGAGRTPFSRGGDGRAALGPVLREYVVSEAMAALGIPTTRALAAVTTGEEVFREEVLPGAVLTRVGTFQYFAARGDAQAIRTLADYVIGRNYPEAEAADNPYVALLRQVIARTAALVARWQLVGFIHGVMNTDNMAVSGETIDYGPCAFMDSYHPATVYSSIDHAGRYAYGNQPRIAYWNLARLAETLLPLLADDEAAGISAAHAALDTYPAAYETAYLEGLRAKLGLADAQAGDLALGQALFVAMNEGHADFTLTFRHLCDIAAGGPDDALKALFASADGIAAWLPAWHARRAQQNPPLADIAAAMRAVNPAFIPRNHRIAACIAAALAGDDAPFNRLTEILARPYDDQPEHADYRAPPLPGEVVRQTFCGT